MPSRDEPSAGLEEPPGDPGREAEPCPPRIVEQLAPDAADRALGRMLADEINFAVVSIAADPERRFRPGSLAARVREIYEKRSSSVCKGARSRARSFLSLPKEERERLFGSFAEAGAEALGRFTSLRADPVQGALAARSVRGRIEGFAAEGSLAGQIDQRFFGRPRTTVEAVRALGTELEHSLGREVSMVGSPDYIGFRWLTAEPEAETLRWELSELGEAEPLAKGTTGSAPQGTFFIDFKDHLPPRPAKNPLRYVLRCQPWIRPRLRRFGAPVDPGRPAGAPALPIRIVYAVDESQTSFDFAEVYRNLDLFTDSITMVQDQDGAGDEEFTITGVVQDVLGTGTGRESIGPLLSLRTKSKVLAEEVGSREEFSDVVERRYRLNNPDAPAVDHEWWPRAYVVTLTVWEADGGDEVASFISDLSGMLNDYLENAWADAVLDALDFLGIELTPVQVNQLTAILYAASAGTVLGVVTAAVGFVLAAVVADFADDFYGSKSSTLRLPSSEVDSVHGLPIDGRAGSPLPGGGWRLATDVLEFKGAPGAVSAAGFDGIVEIRLHWELTGREIWR